MREPRVSGPEYLFLDEAQFMRDCGTWIKHQVDFNKERRIVFTGSAMPLLHKEQESGVGRWHTLQLSTLSFYESLQLKKHINSAENNYFRILNAAILNDDLGTKKFLENKFAFNAAVLPELPSLNALSDLFEWPQARFYQVKQLALSYAGHFHDYLLRGGFPQAVQVNSIEKSQKLLREDIIDKALKRDMTALFGVRRVLDLEQTFLYLCMHDGGMLDIQNLCANLEVKRATVQNFIELLEAVHLIYRLQPYGYGKEILRAKYKIYLADAAIVPAVLIKGKAILDDPTALGVAVETAVFKHLFAHSYAQNVRLTYGQSNKKQEVDILAEMNNQLIPFEVKYRAQYIEAAELKGLRELCQAKGVKHTYIITKSIEDFELYNDLKTETKIMRIPAALFCYWMGESEVKAESFIN